MSFVSESYRFSEDPAAGYSRLVFAFATGSFEPTTFGIDGATVLGQFSDLPSLGDTLQEFKTEVENGTSDPTDLVKETEGGLRVEYLKPSGTNPNPRIKVGTIGGSPELQLARAWALIDLTDEIFLATLTDEDVAMLEAAARDEAEA